MCPDDVASMVRQSLDDGGSALSLPGFAFSTALARFSLAGRDSGGGGGGGSGSKVGGRHKPTPGFFCESVFG